MVSWEVPPPATSREPLGLPHQGDTWGYSVSPVCMQPAPGHACRPGFPWNYSSLSPADEREGKLTQKPPADRLVMSLLSTDAGLLGSSGNARREGGLCQHALSSGKGDTGDSRPGAAVSAGHMAHAGAPVTRAGEAPGSPRSQQPRAGQPLAPGCCWLAEPAPASLSPRAGQAIWIRGNEGKETPSRGPALGTRLVGHAWVLPASGNDRVYRQQVLYGPTAPGCPRGVWASAQCRGHPRCRLLRPRSLGCRARRLPGRRPNVSMISRMRARLVLPSVKSHRVAPMS